MEIHLDSHSEHLIERQLQSGRYHSAEEVVVNTLERIEAPAHFPR